MNLRRVTAAFAVPVLACTALTITGGSVVAPAAAGPEVDQLVRDGAHFPVSISTDVPPGGTSMITTPTLGKDVDKLKVTVQPKNADEAEKATFDQFINTIGSLPKGKRLMVCTMVYQAVAAPQDIYTDEFEVDALHATFAGAVLLACLEMAGLLDGSTQARSSAAASACGQVRPSLPTTVEKVDGGYSLTASGTIKKARKPKLRVGCQVKGNKFIYTIRAAKKGVSLRKAAGKKISVGIKSPPDAATSVPVKITFATP